MKFLTLLMLAIVSINIFADEIIHQNCQDYTFAYNSMSVSESEEKIHFTLSGIVVLNLGNEFAQTYNNFSVDKSNCSMSDDKKLISCYLREEVIVESASFMNRLEKEEIVLNNLSVSIRYVEGAGFIRGGFELYLRYQTDQSENFKEDRVTFPGSRELGCHR